MKIVNHTPYQADALPSKDAKGRAFLTVIVKGTFTITSDRPVTSAAEQMPIAYTDDFFDSQNGGSVRLENDIAPFKPRADIVLVGHAYAAPGLQVASMDVGFEVGSIRKRLRVYGDRHWRCWTLLPPRPTNPKPFTRMPIIYERAFGGIDAAGGGCCRENPVGKGYLAGSKKQASRGAALPNVEDPACLMRAPNDRLRPAGFGFYGRDWQPRVGYLGTYDEAWRLTRSPDPPADFNDAFYNAAHPDLQVEGYLRGDETVVLHHLTPEGTSRFQLPGVNIDCLVAKSYDLLADCVARQTPDHPDLEKLQEMPGEQAAAEMHLDTLCLLPDEKRLFLLWRGRTPLLDQTALEVEEIHITDRSAG